MGDAVADDPADAAWIGHAFTEPEPWWQRRRRPLVGVAVVIAVIGLATWLLVRTGEADTNRPSEARNDGALVTNAAATGNDVVDPAIAPVDPDTSKTVNDADRPLPDVSSAVVPDRVRDAKPLTGPTGDVGLSARVEHSDLPTLYINDGSGIAGASFDGWGATAHLFGDLQGLDTLLRIRLDQLGAAMGVRLEVISGFRTHEEQQALYAQYLSGTGNLAAVPGSSRHESGRAADVYVDGVALANVSGARDAAAKLGIGFPVGGEAWHTELVGAVPD